MTAPMNIRLGTMMVGVAIAAVAGALGVAALDDREEIAIILVIPSLPMGSLIAFALCGIVAGLRRAGEAGPAAIGFVAGGTLATVVSVLVFAFDIDQFLAAFRPVMDLCERVLTPRAAAAASLFIDAAVLAIPQVAVACLSARWARRVGLRLSIEGRPASSGRESGTETVPGAGPSA